MILQIGSIDQIKKHNNHKKRKYYIVNKLITLNLKYTKNFIHVILGQICKCNYYIFTYKIYFTVWSGE